MSYQSVGSPRFYVDSLQWFSSIGVGHHHADYPVTGLNPSSFVDDIPEDGVDFTFNTDISFNFNYWGLLGHAGATTEPYIQVDYGNYFLSNNTQEEIVNSNGGSTSNITFNYDGFSLIKMVLSGGGIDNVELSFSAGDSLKIRMGTPIGCFTMGNIYDMPHSPDLKLTMTREMDGVKRIRTKGGADLVNHRYIKPAMWTDKDGVGGAAWELYSGTPTNQALSRSGRRVWDLSFSYLQDSDMYAPRETIGSIIFDTEGYEEGVDYASETNYWMENMRFLAHNDFYTQVIHKTNGGQLPFIFQPDKNNNNPDGFAICKFDMNSFKFEQVANGVYNVKLKIREVW